MKKTVVEVYFPIIDRFKDAEVTKGKSQSTINTYGHVLDAFKCYLDKNGGNINVLTRFDVQSYIGHLEANGKSPTTINKVFAAISVFARFINRPQVIENIRIPEVRQTRHIAPKCLEKKQRNSLLRGVEIKGNLRDIAITYLLLYTGIRVSELVALNRNDLTIRERSGFLIVRNGKGNVARKVPLSSEVRLHLSRYLDTRQENHNPLFLSNYGRRISVRSVQRVLKGYGVHPHLLRHTFCRELVRQGIDISTVADLAGHADINVTRRYSKPNERELGEAIDKAFS